MCLTVQWASKYSKRSLACLSAIESPLPLCCGWADLDWDLSEPLARLGEFVGRCVIGFVPVQALCGVGVCFLLDSIVSVWSAS